MSDLTPSQKRELNRLKDKIEAHTGHFVLDSWIVKMKTKEVEGFTIEQWISIGKRGGIKTSTRVNGGKWIN